MKISIFTLLVSFLFIKYASCADENASAESLGSGLHFPYELKRWHGKEQLVTKLTKAGEVYEFVRVSKEEFHVRQGGAAGEVFFRFNTEFTDGGVILSSGKLVDLLKTQDTVTALMYGEQGYFLIGASKKAPELKKGQIYIIPKQIRVQNWHRTFLARSRDYYQGIGNVRYPLSDKIASVRLLDSRKIEFVYNDPSGNKGVADVFFYKGDTLFKNEKELVKKAIVTDCISKDESWLKDLDSALQNKIEREEYLKYYDKVDLLTALSNASNPQTHEKLISLVEKVYASPKK